MKLAAPIIVDIAGEAIELRPSLSHAFAVFRRHTLEGLAKGIAEGSLTLAYDLIAPNFPRRLFERDLMEVGLDNLADPLLRYVSALAGIDLDAAPEPAKGKAAPASPEENLIALYRVATGWLSWPPQIALDATTAEIIEAHKGRMEMLRAIFGREEKTPEAREELTLDQKFQRAVLAFNPTIEG